VVVSWLAGHSARATEFDSSHEELKVVHDEDGRQTRREAFSTPAMGMRLAKGPMRLETILYTDWRMKLVGDKRQAVRKTRLPGALRWRCTEQKVAQRRRSETGFLAMVI
jgi:hypothetical protein